MWIRLLHRNVDGDISALRQADVGRVVEHYALQGLPCGEVVEVTELAKDDYAVSCKDTNKYRVYMNAEGRVVREAEVAD